MKTINSFKHLMRLTGTHQVTAQELLNGQTHLEGKGWSKIQLKPVFMDELLDILSEIYGGRSETKLRIRNNLRWERRQHWGLSRTVVSKRGKRIGMQYITGQDQTWENREIRKALS